MAQKADGTVYIDTLMNTYGFEAGGKEVEAAARRMAQTVNQIGGKASVAFQKLTDSFVKQNQSVAAQKQKVADLEKEYEKLSTQKIETKEYSEISKQAENLENELDKLIEKQMKFLDGGGDRQSWEFYDMEFEIDNLKGKFDEAIAKKRELESSGEAYETVDFAPLENKIFTERQKLQQMTDSLATYFRNLQVKLNSYSKTADQASGSGNRFTKSVTSLSSGVKRTAAAMLGLNKNTRRTEKSFSSWIKKILAYAIGLRTLYAAFNKVRQGITEGIKNLVQYDAATNKSLSSLKSSLTQLKNSLATAFNPILNVVAPILTQFVNLLSRAATQIGMFFAALTGQKTFTKAIAVQEDYAASLRDTADAAKDASKGVAGFDEVNQLSNKTETESSSKGAVSPSEMFEMVEVEDKISKLSEMIKNLWNDRDFKGIGDVFAQKINSALGSWDAAETARTLSDKVKSVFDMLLGFVQGIDWQQVGQKAAQFVFNIDWGGLIARFYEGAGTIFGAITGFLWGVIREAWTSVKTWWSNLMEESGGDVVLGLLLGITHAIANIGTWIVDHIFKPFIDGFKKAFGIASPSKVMKEQGEYIVTGFLNGITNLPEKAKEVFQKVLNNIKDVFGNIGSWFKNKFSSALESVKGIFTGNTKLFSGISAPRIAINDIPEYTATVSFNTPNIPYLATGAVIPPNAPFMAMMGDQKNGTNLEAPESLLRQIYSEENAPMIAILQQMLDVLKAGTTTSLNVDGREIARAVRKGNESLGNQTVFGGFANVY